MAALPGLTGTFAGLFTLPFSCSSLEEPGRQGPSHPGDVFLFPRELPCSERSREGHGWRDSRWKDSLLSVCLFGAVEAKCLSIA